MSTGKRTWVHEQCTLLSERIGGKIPEKGYVLFETGYGPSGPPHIGTFGEVVRTAMVLNQFRRLHPDIPTKLWVFSDDMDGLRKIPDNVPSPELMKQFIGRPLTAIPDPFRQHDSYGAQMNSRLRSFLDHFGFSYEFKSATTCYKSGEYNSWIHKILVNYEKVRELVLPILGEERQKTYHPLLPLCQKTGKLLIADIVDVNPDNDTIVYVDEEGEKVQISALNGNCKMQWKIDWGLRWLVFGVDYEMHGKDLESSAEIAEQLCEMLGHRPPLLYQYEMFLDAEGKKISKSKGNGLSTEQWLRYAPVPTLALYMYTNPHRAKKLSLDVVPKTVDEYLRHSASFPNAEDKESNPLWHIHDGLPPQLGNLGLSFSMMIDIAAACSPENAAMLRTFIGRIATSDITAEGKQMLDDLAEKAMVYYNENVKPFRQYRQPNEQERAGLQALRRMLDGCTIEAPDQLQELALLAGEEAGYERSNMKPWFAAIYNVLFGQNSGPRIGTFIAIYGAPKAVKMIDERLCEVL
jgi:lysyl-tRNA synthetase class 1